MSFIIACRCGQQMTVQDDQTGLEAMCVKCHSRIRVPEPPPAGINVTPAIMVAAPGPQMPPQAPGGFGGPASGLPGGPGMWLKPHRAGTIMVLGIVAVLLESCCCSGLWAGLPAVLMASADLREMKAGVMDPSGQRLTTAGLVLGYLSLGLLLLSALSLLTGIGPSFQQFGSFGQFL